MFQLRGCEMAFGFFPIVFELAAELLLCRSVLLRRV
jgi:hypothetical protein